jgi:hypothetical protein
MTEENYSNVGHRGPVYKGLGAMNPCYNQSTLSGTQTISYPRTEQWLINVEPRTDPNVTMSGTQTISYPRIEQWILNVEPQTHHII